MASTLQDDRPFISLLDYGAGNVQSLRNALDRLGYRVEDIQTPQQLSSAQRIIFPGVGSFQSAVQALQRANLWDALKDYLQAGRPYFGICLGMQLLFDVSSESNFAGSSSSSELSVSDERTQISEPTKSSDVAGLGLISGRVERFQHSLPIPHIGWSKVEGVKDVTNLTNENEKHLVQEVNKQAKSEYFYFVHSYRVLPNELNKEWLLTVTQYGEKYISAIQKGFIMATQFHPEKSSAQGLATLSAFLRATECIKSPTITIQPSATNGHSSSPSPSLSHSSLASSCSSSSSSSSSIGSSLTKRIIACLDVRSNDAGDLVVTKGDQYDVREHSDSSSIGKGAVRNLGKPVELAKRYFEEGADEIVFLNITSFRNEPLADSALLSLLQETSKHVFIPLCIGGGIRDYTDSTNRYYSALDVASAYFRAGADKISIGSDSVLAAEEYFKNGKKKTGKSSIEQISQVYGVQAVVVSVDPKRVYVNRPEATKHHTVKTLQKGKNAEEYCWWQCTVKGGRETRDIDVVELAQAVQDLGAGELLVNSIDCDGTKAGFDIELIELVTNSVHIPVIASSGAGKVEHFSELFEKTNASAGLAAGIFHRREVPIGAVKQHLKTTMSGKLSVRM